ncbi:MAG: hypothetical protein EXR93_12740 [Gemmatimonadetes bacterium]|nr:hypothetical protein [Gemmatimonadota bacterium]
MARWRRILASTSVAFGLSGCHGYQLIDPGVVPPNSVVRVQVDEGTATYLTQLTGWAPPNRRFEGKMLTVGRDSLWMAMAVATVPNGVAGESIGQRVILARGRIGAMELRKLDWARTGVVSALAAGVMVVATMKIFDGGFGGDTRGSPPGSVDLRLPLALPSP